MKEKVLKNRIEYMKQDDKVDILFKKVQYKNTANFLEWVGTYTYLQSKDR